MSELRTTPSPRVRAVIDHLEHDRKNALERLFDFLRIPSISSEPDYAPDMRRGAAWSAKALTGVGLTARIEETAGHPVVIATTPDEHLLPDAPKHPHVLFYGHYDVQPADPVDRWTTPAFEPAIRDGAIYARGASDDKGQVCTFLEALRGWYVKHGGLPIRITVMLEGEEEIGSPNLRAFLEANRERLKADVMLICDTNMWDDDTVAITYGLRGMAYFDIKLHNANKDLHSGMYGGTLANPLVELTSVLGKLFDENHRVTIPGFYDDVIDVTDEERRRWNKLDFDEMRDCLTPIGVTTPFGEAGYSTLERRWARPACDICGLYGGYGGPGSKTVIATTAGAKVSFRLAPNQHPDKIGDAFVKWLKSHDVHGCRWEITPHGRAEPVIVATESPYMQAAQAAVKIATGKPAVLMREGATIPILAAFQQILGMDAIMLGFARDDDAVHSPNEKYNLASFELGTQTHAVLLDTFSQMK